MPNSRFAGSLTTPIVNVGVDIGNPLLNRNIGGFLKIGAVAATKSLTEDAYYLVKRGEITSRNMEKTLKKMCQEGVYWGKHGVVSRPMLQLSSAAKVPLRISYTAITGTS